MVLAVVVVATVVRYLKVYVGIKLPFVGAEKIGNSRTADDYYLAADLSITETESHSLININGKLDFLSHSNSKVVQ